MRLLVLYQARDAEKDQPGYYDGFRRLVKEGMLEAHAAIAFYSIAEERGWNELWEHAYKTAAEVSADAVFLQFFHGATIPDPSNGIHRLKSLPTNPVIFTSLGDPFGRWTKRIPGCFRVASRLGDATFLTGMGYVARQLERWGSKNLVLMPHGCCQVRFGSQEKLPKANPSYDVVFIGSRLRPRNPLGHYFWVARRRMEMVEAFTKRYGRRFGLFGYGWDGNPCWAGPVSYARQCEAYRDAAVVLGGMPNAYNDYYASDRPFIAAGSGVVLVDHHVPGVEYILKDGEDWWLAKRINGMIECCDRLLAVPQTDRLLLGRKTRERILAAHTQYHRCREMVQIAKGIREAKMSGRRAAEPKLSFLIDPKPGEECPPAIVNWLG